MTDQFSYVHLVKLGRLVIQLQSVVLAVGLDLDFWVQTWMEVPTVGQPLPQSILSTTQLV